MLQLHKLMFNNMRRRKATPNHHEDILKDMCTQLSADHFLNVYCGLDFRQLISNFSPSCPDPVQREEINFYFCTSLWCHKRFYEGLKGLHKTF